MTLTALVLMLFVGPTSGPQPSASIRGLVVDATTNAPLADARVEIVDLGRSTHTNAGGRFEFTAIPPGAHTLTVSTIGYIFVRRNIDAPATGVLDLTLPLTGGTGAYRETVTVAATGAADGPVSSQSSLGSAGLQELRGVAADDPLRAMQALPGVATGDDFQAQFSVRGSSFRQVGIVNDGTATPLLLHAIRGQDDTGSIAMINTDVLSSATLTAGPQPRRDGDWLGASLTFDIREGSRDRTGVRAAVSGTSASAVAEGPIGAAKRGSWIVSVRKSYVGWLIRKVKPDIDDTVGFVDTQGKLVYDLTSRQQLQLVVIGGHATFDNANSSLANGLNHATSVGGLASLAWRYTRARAVFTERVSFVSSDFHDHGLIGQELGDGLTQSTIVRSDVAVPLDARWSVDAGLRAESQHATQTLTDFVPNLNGTVRERSTQSIDARATYAGAWASLDRRTDRSTVTLGARVTRSTLGGETMAAPWILGERRIGGFTFRAGAGGSGQFADLTMLQADGATIAAPERARLVDAGVEQQITPTTSWKVTAFGRRDLDLIRPVGEDQAVNGRRVVASTYPEFAGELTATTGGVDVVVSRRAASGLTGWIGYTYAHTRDRDNVTGERFDGDFDQRHTLNAFVQQRLSYRFDVSAKLRVGSNFPIVGYFAGTPDVLTLSTERNQVRLPVYARLDLRANRTFTFSRRRLTLFVEVMNALGRDNLRQSAGTIRSNLTTAGLVEAAIPFVPSAGFLIEF